VVISVFPWGSGFPFCVFLVHLLARGWREWFYDSDPSLITLQHWHLYRKSSHTLKKQAAYAPQGLRGCEYHIFECFIQSFHHLYTLCIA